MPKEANCSLCCVCRSISSKQVDGKDFFPVFGSCWEYCAQLWAHQYKENIDLKELMEQDQCDVLYEKKLGKWIYSEKAKGRP